MLPAAAMLRREVFAADLYTTRKSSQPSLSASLDTDDNATVAVVAKGVHTARLQRRDHRAARLPHMPTVSEADTRTSQHVIQEAMHRRTAPTQRMGR
jgi:hypothetical protein